MEEYILQHLQAALSVPVQWGYFRDRQSLPRVTMTRTGGSRTPSYKGGGLRRGSVQIDCFDVCPTDAMRLGREVVSALENHMGGPIVGARLTSERDSFDRSGNAAARSSLTFALTWRG